MGLETAIKAVGAAAEGSGKAFGGFEKAISATASTAKSLDGVMASLMKSFLEVGPVVKYEKSLLEIQRTTGKTVKEIKKLETVFKRVAKGSRYSRDALAKLTSGMSNHISMITMTNKSTERFLKTMSSKFVVGMEQAIKVLAALGDEYSEFGASLAKGDVEWDSAVSQLTSFNVLMEKGPMAVIQMNKAMTGHAKGLGDLTDAQQRQEAAQKDAKLAFGESMKEVSKGVMQMQTFLASILPVTKALSALAAAMGAVSAAKAGMRFAAGGGFGGRGGKGGAGGGAAAGGYGSPTMAGRIWGMRTKEGRKGMWRKDKPSVGQHAAAIRENRSRDFKKRMYMGHMPGQVIPGTGGMMGPGKTDPKYFKFKGKSPIPQRAGFARKAIGTVGGGKVGMGLKKAMGGLTSAILPMAGMLLKLLGPLALIGTLVGVIMLLNKRFKSVSGFFTRIKRVVEKVVRALDTAFMKIAEPLMEAMEPLIELMGSFAEVFGDATISLIKTMADLLVPVIKDFLIPVLNNLIDAAYAVANKAVDASNVATPWQKPAGHFKRDDGSYRGKRTKKEKGLDREAFAENQKKKGLTRKDFAKRQKEYFKAGDDEEKQAARVGDKKALAAIKARKATKAAAEAAKQAAQAALRAEMQRIHNLFQILDIEMKIADLKQSALQLELSLAEKTGATWRIIGELKRKDIDEQIAKLEVQRKRVAEVEAQRAKGIKKAAEEKAEIVMRRKMLGKNSWFVNEEEDEATLKGHKTAAKRADKNVREERIKEQQMAIDLKKKMLDLIDTEYNIKKKLIGLDQQNLANLERIAMATRKGDPAFVIKIKKESIKLDMQDLHNVQVKIKKTELARKKAIEAARIVGGRAGAEKESAKWVGIRKKLQTEETGILATISEKADYIRRTWLEQYAEMAIGAQSGTYLVPGASDLSGMQTKGAAFRPWAPTQSGGGAGTYKDIYGKQLDPALETGRSKLESQLKRHQADANNAVKRLSDVQIKMFKEVEDRIRKAMTGRK